MQCDTCKRETPVVRRVVVAPGYNRSLARPVFNCPACYEQKERRKPYAEGRGGPPTKEGAGST